MSDNAESETDTTTWPSAKITVVCSRDGQEQEPFGLNLRQNPGMTGAVLGALVARAMVMLEGQIIKGMGGQQ